MKNTTLKHAITGSFKPVAYTATTTTTTTGSTSDSNSNIFNLIKGDFMKAQAAVDEFETWLGFRVCRDTGRVVKADSEVTILGHFKVPTSALDPIQKSVYSILSCIQPYDDLKAEDLVGQSKWDAMTDEQKFVALLCLEYLSTQPGSQLHRVGNTDRYEFCIPEYNALVDEVVSA